MTMEMKQEIQNDISVNLLKDLREIIARGRAVAYAAVNAAMIDTYWKIGQRIVVEEQEAYLEPHLTIQDVADRCGYSRSSVAGAIKSEYGGFFDYINGLRIKSMAAYQNQHPEATVQEAAEVCGFASRQAYYMVKARLEKQG